MFTKDTVTELYDEHFRSSTAANERPLSKENFVSELRSLGRTIKGVPMGKSSRSSPPHGQANRLLGD